MPDGPPFFFPALYCSKGGTVLVVRGAALCLVVQPWKALLLLGASTL